MISKPITSEQVTAIIDNKPLLTLAKINKRDLFLQFNSLEGDDYLKISVRLNWHPQDAFASLEFELVSLEDGETL